MYARLYAPDKNVILRFWIAYDLTSVAFVLLKSMNEWKNPHFIKRQAFKYERD